MPPESARAVVPGSPDWKSTVSKSNHRPSSHLGLLLLLFATLFAPSLPAAEQSQTGELIDRIVAVVNDDVITQLELDAEVADIKRQLRAQQTQLPPEAVLRRQILERMILRHIQLQMAQRMHITVDDDSLNRAIANIAAQNGMDLGQFRETLAREGIDYARFRENIRDEIVINRLQKRQVADRIDVTSQEIDAYLANQAVQGGKHYLYHLGHILIGLPEAASAEAIGRAREKAWEVVAELRAGADFAATAVAVSDGRQALQGGDLGWREASALPTLFADWVLSHAPGDISDPIRSPSGFHIIKLLERRSDQPQHLVTQTHARHILVRTGPARSDQRARQRIETLRSRLQAGEDFAELARANSDDPGTAAAGGDLGWVNPGTMVPPFEKAMDALQPGQLSAPVKTRFGWHLIEVLERRQQDRTKEVQRNQASETIRQRKLDPAMQAWLRKLRDEAFVDVRL